MSGRKEEDLLFSSLLLNSTIHLLIQKSAQQNSQHLILETFTKQDRQYSYM